MRRDPSDGSAEEPTQRVTVGTPLRWLVAVLVLGALLVAKNFVGTIVLASWFVSTLWPVRAALEEKMGHPRLVSSALTTVVIVAIVAPFTILGVVVAARSGEWVDRALTAFQQGQLRAALESSFAQPGGTIKLGDLYREAASAVPSVLASVGTIFHVVSDLVVKLFLFVLATYSFFAKGPSLVAWLERASPFEPSDTRHLMKTYAETGRGILVGVFLVIVLHGIVAVIGYTAIGVPRSVELGVLTALVGLVPAIGTGLVWVPLAGILAATGHPMQGLSVFVLGIVIGSVDNLLRPYLAKLGKVPLPTFALFVAFFGGIAVFGASGLLLGPLVFSLAKAAMDRIIAQRERGA